MNTFTPRQERVAQTPKAHFGLGYGDESQPVLVPEAEWRSLQGKAAELHVHLGHLEHTLDRSYFTRGFTRFIVGWWAQHGLEPAIMTHREHIIDCDTLESVRRTFAELRAFDRHHHTETIR